jgi:hypothetical protein
MASLQLLVMRIAGDATSFSPLPYHVWPGYRISIAHRVEVEVGAHGHVSAPPSGAAAAVPPAGAVNNQGRTVWTEASPPHRAKLSVNAVDHASSDMSAPAALMHPA